MQPLTKLAAALAAVAAPLMLPASALADNFSFSYSTSAPHTQVVHMVPQPVYTHYYPQRVVVREQVAYRPIQVGYWGRPNTVAVHQYDHGHRRDHDRRDGHGYGKKWRGHGHGHN